MNILITGGAGFIGSHIVDACVARGMTVAVIDNCSTGSRANIAGHIEKGTIQFFEGNICDEVFVNNIFEEFKPEAIFHLAAHIDLRESIRNPKKDIDANVIGTLVILDAMRKYNCKRIIFSSTGGALFSHTPPFRETDQPSPKSPYGIAKYTDEMLLEFYAREYGFVVTALRYANVYGPRQNPLGEAGVIAIFTDKIHKGETPTIYGDGTQTRDYIHVSDVVTANLHVFDKSLTGAYHVGTGKETSVNDLWKVLAETFKTTLIPKYVPTLGEIPRSALDSSKLQATGWKINEKVVSSK